MEGRLIEYRPLGGGLDYHHNSPLIGEIPNNEYSHVVHRSIDQLRNSLNERVTLGPLSVFSSVVAAGNTSAQSNTNTNLNGTDLRTSVLAYNTNNLSNEQLNHNNTERLQQHQQQQHHHQHHYENNNLKNHQCNLDSNTTNSNETIMNTKNLINTDMNGMLNTNTRCLTERPRKSRANYHHHHHHQLEVEDGELDINQNPNITSTTNGINHHHHQLQQHNQQSVSPLLQDTKDTKIFSSKADLQLHTQIHMREAKPYKCSQCSKAFANSSYLSQHTRIHLGIKPYRCEICQRKFTQLSHLQQHIRTHTGDKPYKCRHPGCQKAFSQLSNLQSHSRCHQTDKPYKCNSCYKCFTDEPSLLEHIPKHKESKHLKTHICQYCGKSYTQETYLTKHMQKHSERTDKRPPITTGMTTTAGNNNNNNNNNNANQNNNGNAVNGTNVNVNRNIGLNTNLTTTGGDHPYWPKVSPDSQASLTDVMHQQQQQHGQPQQQQQQQTHHDFPPLNGQQQQQQPQHSQPNDLQSHHRMLDNGSGGREEVATTPTGSVIGHYDASSITKTTSNSAFTPINSMVSPHLNMHPMQRPYLYDAISFPNGKTVNQNTTAAANSFPNQLISLHQIRNYAHQPSGLMAGEHLLGVSVGAGK